MTPDHALHLIVEQVSAGTYPYETLREGNKEGLIARVTFEDKSTAIFKYWKRPGLRGALRRMTQTGTAYLERGAIDQLQRNGLTVPKVYDIYHLKSPDARHTECLIQEDLGRCQDTTEFLKAHIHNGNEAAVKQFDAEIIRSTKIMIDSRVLDTDHRLPNYVITQAEHPVRLDFELAQRVWNLRFHTQQYGQMLGTLLGSYVFAVQPDSKRMEQFTKQLIASLKPPKAVLIVAGQRIKEMIERQKNETGLNTVFIPPWEQKGMS